MREEILKALLERNKTLSELSKELDLTKPSVYYHLKRLSAEGLVRRLKNGNKFVYYALTEKGREFAKLIVSSLISCLLSYAIASGVKNETPVGRCIGYVGYVTSSDFSVAYILAFVFIFITIYFTIKLFEKT